VTIGATADDTGVVHRPAGETARTGIACRMACLAWPTGRQVVHRLGYRCHACKDLAVVTSRTTAGDTGMVHDPRVIARAIMTERAGLRGRQVIGRLAAAGCNREAGC
jgi:hypothetical protein